jgi:NADH:ubiquinone oxidoreductase subunit E
MLFFSVMQVCKNLSCKLCAIYHVVARIVKQFDQELL